MRPRSIACPGFVVILSGAKDRVPSLGLVRSSVCLPELKPWISACRRVTFFYSEKSNQKRRHPTAAPLIAKAKSAMRGTLRFSLVAGSADRPSLACLRTLRHPCLAPREHTRGLNAAPSLRCSAPPTGGGKSKANCQRRNRKRFRLLRYWFCAFTSRPTRSRMREALPTSAVFDVPPRWRRRASQLAAI